LCAIYSECELDTKKRNLLERFAEPFLYLNVHQTVKNKSSFLLSVSTLSMPCHL